MPVKPPQSFLDFTREFHQDLDLVHPWWAEDAPQGRYEIYEDFRQSYGDVAVQELAAYFKRMRVEPDHVLRALWFRKSKAECVVPGAGVRRIFEEFEVWAARLQ